MTNLNEIMQPKRESITHAVNNLKNGKFFVDSSFQRKLIWTEAQKVRLIETVLMGYPMPEIYLWAQSPDPDSGEQRFSIVDGQQRVTSVRQFVDGEWPLKKSSLDRSNRDSEFAGKYWSEISPELKSKIWEYNLNIREIPSSVSLPAIHDIFSRLNQTDKSLNPQEMRNAKFHGEFINAAVTVADRLNAREWKIFSDTDIRRMKDVEFGSQLLSYLLRGIVSDTPKKLNELYDTYNDVYEKKRSHLLRSNRLFDSIGELFENPTIEKFFSKPIHFYTLFAALDISSHTDQDVTKEGLENFVVEYGNHNFDDEAPDRLLNAYKTGSSYSTAGGKSRENRIYSLIDFLNS